MRTKYRLRHGDCLKVMRQQDADSIDLIVTSPPYEDARAYDNAFGLKGQAWVDWMMPRVEQMVRICRGPVFIVCEGKTRSYRWSATPVLLMADLHRAGFNLRKPPIMQRWGIAGSGGPDWLRNRYEFIIAVTPKGRLPWSDNTACGRPPKCDVGGDPSSRKRSGERTRAGAYKPPKRTNPGNVIDVGANTHFGIGNENEAPFDLRVPEFFVRSFCPVRGIVCDPFCGSGTTGEAAIRNGRKFFGIDDRKSQIDLSRRRIVAACERTAKGE